MTAGSPCSPSSPWPRTRSPPPESQARPVSSPTSQHRSQAARPGRRRRHPHHPPCRQGPRVARRATSSACTRARCRSPMPRRPAQVEEERRLLYVGATRARDRLSISWSPEARSPGGRRTSRVTAGSSTARWPAQQRRGPTRSGRRPRQGQAVGAGARPAGSATDHWTDAKRTQARSLPGLSVDLRRSGLRRAQGLAQGARDRRHLPAYVVFTDATLTALAELRPVRRRRGCWAVPGIGARQGRPVWFLDVLALCAGWSDSHPQAKRAKRTKYGWCNGAEEFGLPRGLADGGVLLPRARGEKPRKQ